eukprot:scaffold333_cov133-Cylindrotheca_fusiformis.AAC.29
MGYDATARMRRFLAFSKLLKSAFLLALLFDSSGAFQPFRRSWYRRHASKYAVNGDSSSPREPMQEGVGSSSLVKKTEHSVFESSTNWDALPDRKIDLMFCAGDICKDAVRQRVVGKHNQIVLSGPATGQVGYKWNQESVSRKAGGDRSETSLASVLMLVRPNDESLIEKVAEVVPKLTHLGIKVLLVAEVAAKLKFNHGVDDDRICLFEVPSDKKSRQVRHVSDSENEWVQEMVLEPFPDLVCTLGGDGSITFASMMFQGPVPPIMSIAGGSLGFLTAFQQNEMEDAICIALGIENKDGDVTGDPPAEDVRVFPPNMEYASCYPPRLLAENPKQLSFGKGDFVCMTIRMRLDCRIVSPEGIVRCRYNVLNEVVVDRGSSPYLAALECFCDDVHLTTVHADGVIFAT